MYYFFSSFYHYYYCYYCYYFEAQKKGGKNEQLVCLKNLLWTSQNPLGKKKKAWKYEVVYENKQKSDNGAHHNFYAASKSVLGVWV